MITDAAGPIAVAGVMGGAETEVTDATTYRPAGVGELPLRLHPQDDAGAEAPQRGQRPLRPGGPARRRPARRDAGDGPDANTGRGEIAQGVADCYPAPQAATA